MNTPKRMNPPTRPLWIRIPDGSMVRHRREGHGGYIDGLTELVLGPARNPDGKTQYGMNVGASTRELVVEDDLCIVIDAENLVMMRTRKRPTVAQ